MSEAGGAPHYCPMCGCSVDLAEEEYVVQHKSCIDWGIYMKVYSTVDCWKKACIKNGIRVARALLNT